jgi:CHASE3 domain sensor protein
MKPAATPRARAIRQKNLFMLVAGLLIVVGFYFLTLVRMGEQSARDKHQAPSETSSMR